MPKFLLFMMLFMLISCSRAGNLDYLKVGDSVDAMYKNWGEPMFIDKINENVIDLSYATIGGGAQVIYYYKFGFDRYKIICVNNRVYRRFHTNELGSGPYIELDRDDAYFPFSFYNDNNFGNINKKNRTHEGIGVNLNEYKFEIKTEDHQ